LEKYVTKLKMEDNSIFKPTRNKRNSKTTSPPIRKNSKSPGPLANSDKEKAELYAGQLSEVFSPYNNDQEQEMEQEPATPIQSQECFEAFTLKERKMKSKC